MHRDTDTTTQVHHQVTFYWHPAKQSWLYPLNAEWRNNQYYFSAFGAAGARTNDLLTMRWTLNHLNRFPGPVYFGNDNSLTQFVVFQEL